MEGYKVYGVKKAFTDLTDGNVYQTSDFYITNDDDRAKELSTKENKRGEVIIYKLTKKELNDIAEKRNIEVDSKMKVDELSEKMAGELS